MPSHLTVTNKGLACPEVCFSRLFQGKLIAGGDDYAKMFHGKH